MGVQEIIGLAVSNGLFAALFTLLLFYVLRDANKREKKYNDTIDTLTAHLGIALNEVRTEIGGVKARLEHISKHLRGQTNEKEK